MDRILKRSLVPQILLVASDDCDIIADELVVLSSQNWSVSAPAYANLAVKICPLDQLASHRDVQPDIDVLLVNERRKDSQHSYFHRFLGSLIEATCRAEAAQPWETWGHPIAAILVVTSADPDPITTISSLYRQSYEQCPSFVSAEFLRCIWYVEMPESSSDQASASFTKIRNHFGPHCVHTTPRALEGDALQETVTDSVVPYITQVLTSWKTAASGRSLTGTINNSSGSSAGGAFGLGKLLKRVLLSSGPPQPETNLFGDICGAMDQSNWPEIPASKRQILNLDMQMRRLADLAFFVGDYRLANAAYDTLRKTFQRERLWSHFGAVNEMLALSLAQSEMDASYEKLDPLVDNALYTYNSRCHLPAQALRCTLWISQAAIEAGQPIAAAVFLATTLSDIDPVYGQGDHPLQTALLMERIAYAFEQRHNRRKQKLWDLLASRELERAEKLLAEPAITTTTVD